MVDKDEIRRRLRKFFNIIGVVTIDDDGLVSCREAQLLVSHYHTQLPVKFHTVDTFYAYNNHLANLIGAPQHSNEINCVGSTLTSLEGLPTEPHSIRSLSFTYRPMLPLLRCLVSTTVELARAPKEVVTIIARYSGQGEAGAFECGAELASAGYKENARW